MKPLHQISVASGFWILIVLGYSGLSLFSDSIDYNSAPFIVAAYYAVWCVVLFAHFGAHIRREIPDLQRNVIPYVWWILGSGLLLLGCVAVLARGIAPSGLAFPPYTDILFATPLYLIPKAFEILAQQILVAVIVIALSGYFKSLRATTVAFVVLFVGAHLVMFTFTNTTSTYGLFYTLSALAAAPLFPVLILRIHSGFMISYFVHISFYALTAALLHVWPLPGYSCAALHVALRVTSFS